MVSDQYDFVDFQRMKNYKLEWFNYELFMIVVLFVLKLRGTICNTQNILICPTWNEVIMHRWHLLRSAWLLGSSSSKLLLVVPSCCQHVMPSDQEKMREERKTSKWTILYGPEQQKIQLQLKKTYTVCFFFDRNKRWCHNSAVLSLSDFCNRLFWSKLSGILPNF